MTKKLRIDILCILILACALEVGIRIYGKSFGITTPESVLFWSSVVAGGALVLALLMLFDGWGRVSDASRSLMSALQLRAPVAGHSMLAKFFTRADDTSSLQKKPLDDCPFVDLPSRMRARYGWLWCYRHRFLLLTGDDAAVKALFPELGEQSYLITDDAVLFFARTTGEGQPDTAWLQQLVKLRRRRPVDAVVLVVSEASTSGLTRRSGNTYNVLLARIAAGLRWSAPVVVLDLHSHDNRHHGMMVAGSEFTVDTDAKAIKTNLLALRRRLVPLSVQQLKKNADDRYAGELSQRLDSRSETLADWIAGLNQLRQHQPVSAAFFAPYPNPVIAGTPSFSSADLPLWRHLTQTVRRSAGHRVGWHPETVLCTVALTGLGIWITGMLVSATVNQRDIADLQQTVQRTGHAPLVAERVRGLMDLQQDIARYEYRTQHHAPLASRFGLNHDDAVLEALWQPYATASRRMLIDPVQQTLETELIDLTQLRNDQIDTQANRHALDGHQSLKSYLMLAEPARSDAAFLTPQLVRRWQLDTQLSAGEHGDLAQRLLGFYSEHLAAHPDWRIAPSANLVQAARQTLLTAIGVENADTTLYRNIIAAAADKYADQTLASLTVGTDPRGLVRNTAVVSGVFTRQAYEGVIAPAIAEAAKRNTIAGDWVLGAPDQASTEPSPAQSSVHSTSHSAERLQAALTAQYFDEYAEQWQTFMNNMHWEAASTMPAAIEQLKLMADARRSPLIALMKSLQYQGSAGVRQASLSDTLVAKAQHLIASTKVPVSETERPDPAGPLGSAFGPILRLTGNMDGGVNANAHTANDLSLQRYLDRISALRLRLQQINSSPDAEAQARQLALSLFQGKGSELADTTAYAQLVAASLGEQWASMGDALFVRPVAQATQTVLQPAQAGLNEAWHNHIAVAWHRAFSGRYPFARTDNDASLPELARFMRPQNGLIATFLQTQLAGVLELQGDQWVPNAGSNLHFDPAFLTAINTLQRIGARLLVQGEPQYRFELKARPTPGISDMVLTIDAQKLHHYNQQETWQHLVWPVNQTQDAGTCLQWQTERSGTNKQYEFSGRWALIRLLERGHIVPVDSATYQLTWHGTPDVGLPEQAGTAEDRNSIRPAFDADPASDHLMPRAPMTQASSELTYPLSYVLRTEAGRGPLEMLALRDFTLPSRIFLSPSRGTIVKRQPI